MKFRIERRELMRAVQAVDAVVERRSTIPVLANVMIAANVSGLRLTGTDLDIEIGADAVATIEAPGITTVNSAMLLDIAKKLPDGAEVQCAMEEHRMVIKSGRSRFVLMSLPGDDYPEMSSGDYDVRFAVEGRALHRLISKTIFAASTEVTRYYLNGIYLHEKGTTLRAVATDGHRLALHWMDMPGGAAGLPGVIIPRKTCAMLNKALDSVKGDVTVSVSSSKIMVELPGTRMVSKLVDGTFPDYERVIPQSNNKTVIVNVKAMAAAVDRASVVSAEKGRATRFTMKPGEMEIMVIDPNGGTAEDVIEAGYDGPPLEIGFNSRYMLDVLANIETESCRMEMDSAGHPAVVTPEGQGDGKMVIMPMRV